MELAGRTAIVTRASRGMGKAIALALAEAGCNVVVCARAAKSDSPLLGVADEIKKLGRQSLAVKANVAEESDVENIIRQAMNEFGHIDILVNNAGITNTESFLDITIRRWDLIISVNLGGTFLCTKAVLPYMIKQGSGSIINMSSVLAQRIQYSIPYGVSKAAIERFTLGLAREMRKHNIAVSCIRPNFVKTETVISFMQDADTRDWETPEMWSKYVASIAGAKTEQVTGKILDQTLLKSMFGPA